MRFVILLFASLVGCGSSESSVSPGPANDATSNVDSSGTDATPSDGTSSDAAEDTAPVAVAWKPVVPPEKFNARAIRGLGPSDVWFAGFGGTKYGLLHWDGSTFTVHALAMPTAPDDVWPISKNDVWTLGGSPAGPWHYDGSSWKQSTTFKSSALDAVIAFGSKDVWVGGGSSGLSGDAPIHRYDGSTWSPLSTGEDQRVYALWGTSPSDVWACTQTGIRHYASGSWSPMGGSYCESIWGSSGKDIWFASSTVTGKITHWNGTSLEDIATDTDLSLHHLWGSGSKDVWAVGPGTIRRWDGAKWRDGATTDGPSSGDAIGGTSAKDVWIAGYEKLWHLAPVP